jgi:Mor family transcriptional regulator
MKLLSKEGLKRVVQSEFDGNNSGVIARKYGYSVRHINRVAQEKNIISNNGD